MPYKAFEVDDEFCIYKLNDDDEQTGETLGCHPTEDEAAAQVRALYAAEELEEAATLKTRAQALLRDAEAVMGYKNLPEAVRKEIRDLRTVLRRTWADLADEADGNKSDEKPEEQMEEAAIKTEGSEEMEAPSAEMMDGHGGATSFADLRASRKAMEVSEELTTLAYDFQTLANNIIYGEAVDKASLLRVLATEFAEEAETILNAISEREAEPIEEEAAEPVALGESDVGDILRLHESEDIENGVQPLQLDVIVIKPGWGNQRDNHYYSRELLEEYADVFNGAKMYATNHNPDEKNVLTEVSQVLECPVAFTEEGAPVARVGVFDEGFAASIRNRAGLGKLNDLHVSIQADGTAREFEQDGRKGKMVETIIPDGACVDWVTRAGAGGHALRLAEEDTMPDKEDEQTEEIIEEAETAEVVIKEDEQESEQEIEQEAEQETDGSEVVEKEPLALDADRVTTLLAESTLPDASRERLAMAEWSDEGTLAEAIQTEVAYVVALTGAGQPVGQQASTAPKEEKPIEERLSAKFDEIEKRHGIYRGD